MSQSLFIFSRALGLMAALLCGTPLISPAHAEDTAAAPVVPLSATSAPQEDALPDIPKPLKIMPSKIKPVQSATDEMSKAAPETEKLTDAKNAEELETLLPNGSTGYPETFWADAKRDDIAAFLASDAPVSSSLTIRSMALKATLAPTPDLSSSTDPEKNIYALRIKHLVDLGDFADALLLYKMNESDPPTSLAARAGVEAMLGSGQAGVACLEEKALSPSLKKDDSQFWTDTNTFCQALLSPAAGADKDLRLANAAKIFSDVKKSAIPANAAELNALDMLSTVAMAKTNQIAPLVDTQGVATELSDKQISVLWAFLPTTQSAMPIWAEALKRGIASSQDLITKLSVLDLASPTTPYAPFFKEYLKEKQPLLTASLLELADTEIKQDLLLPLYEAQEVAFPETDKTLSLKLLAKANQDFPTSLVRTALNIPESFESGQESGEILTTLHLLKQIEDSKTTASASSYPALLAIKAGLIPEKVKNTAYDNIFNLTAKSNYVMPNAELLSSLKKSAEQKRTDQVLINGLEILTSAPLEKLNPAALVTVFEAFNSAGLTEETTSLAREVLGTLLEK